MIENITHIGRDYHRHVANCAFMDRGVFGCSVVSVGPRTWYGNRTFFDAMDKRNKASDFGETVYSFASLVCAWSTPIPWTESVNASCLSDYYSNDDGNGDGFFDFRKGWFLNSVKKGW